MIRRSAKGKSLQLDSLPEPRKAPERSVDERWVELVRLSSMFDATWCRNVSCITAEETDLIRAYLVRDRSSPLSANPLFDDDWYLAQYTDVASAGLPPLVHYILAGATEGRRPGPLFDPDWYEITYPEARVPSCGPLSYHLRTGRALGNNPNPLFNVAWYLASYPDVAASGMDALEHYVRNGAVERRDTGPEFSTRWYLARNPQVLLERVNPLAHYLIHGRSHAERCSYQPYAGHSTCDSLSPGWAHLRRHNVVGPRLGSELNVHGGRPKLLFVTHEMSRTGAPLIILELIRYFAKLDRFDLILFTDKLGELERDFRRCCHIVDSSRHSMVSNELSLADLLYEIGPVAPLLAFCNTANTNHYSGPLHGFGVPVITLVHELLYAYPESYVRDLYTYSDRIIFPSEFGRNVADAKVLLPPERSRTIPQGLLNPSFARHERHYARATVRRELGIGTKVPLVLGCGSVNLRKGPDMFVRVAQRLLETFEEQVHFVWIGSDTIDMSYAYWLRKDLAALGLDAVVHMIGVKNEPSLYYQAADVFALTSREDPFPCVVHEAMACSLPVIAFAGAGGAPEALAEERGIVVPYGDVSAMAAVIQGLLTDPRRLALIGANALRRVTERYNFASYANSLMNLGRDELGADLGEPVLPTALDRPRVFFFSRDWWISGVNAFTETLMRELLSQGVHAELVFPTFNEANRRFLPALPMRFLDLIGPIAEQWQRLIDFANENAPCILVPNYDYLSSAISPALANGVGIIGIIHSDDVEHYDHVNRLGRYWNRIICSNRHLLTEVVKINPSFADRSLVIPYGVTVPDGIARVPDESETRPIELVFCGRLTQIQKRVRDLVSITRLLERMSVLHRLTVIGEGEEMNWLAHAWAKPIANGSVVLAGRLSRLAMYDVFRNSDVFLLVSDFEGMPISLIEAMGCGCVPVVSDIPSGIPDLVTDDVGRRVLPGDIQGFAEQIAALKRNHADLASMSAAAIMHITRGGFQARDMGQAYIAMLEEVWDEVQTGQYTRPESLVWRSPLSGVSPPAYLTAHADSGSA